MKNYILLMLALCLLTGCGDDEPDFLRSSEGIATEDLHLYVSAEVHTHLGKGDEPDETHTTVQMEYYGYDNNGYFYDVELGKNDQLSVDLGGSITVIPGEPWPSAPDKLYVEYLADFDETAPGTEFIVQLDRNSEANINTTSVILHDLTPISAQPAANSDVTLEDEITLNWTQDESMEEKMILILSCTTQDSATLRKHAHFPNLNQPNLSPPFSFIPSNYFALPAYSELASCELRSSLFTMLDQPEPENSGYNSVTIRTSRENAVTHSILIN